MILSELNIQNVRNIQSARVALNPRFNFVIGPNGSGKTSILEALYLLSCGHSFRSREIAPIITQNSNALTVFASSPTFETLGIQKSRTQPTRIQVNRQTCTSTSALARALPTQVIDSEVCHIVDAGPSVRRSMLDWGLFHVKQEYLGLLKTYTKVLKQRNALLRSSRPSYSDCMPWDEQLTEVAMQMNQVRHEYFDAWVTAFQKILPELTEVTCRIQYDKGWDKKGTGASLADILREHFERDCHRGYTQYGPHQADVLIESNDLKAKTHLSRGQQKMIVIALKMAQCDLLQRPCLILLDDVTAELDETHIQNLFHYLSQRTDQCVVTAIQLPQHIDALFRASSTVFHVKHGVIE